MRKRFIVEVPCTVIDRYVIFADSEVDARAKIEGGVMVEHTDKREGDYQMLANHDFMPHGVTFDPEPKTHWDQVKFVDA